MREDMRAGGMEDQKETVQRCKSACDLCKGGIREYRVWSIEYRERHYFGWQVAASGGGWRDERQRYREGRDPGNW